MNGLPIPSRSKSNEVKDADILPVLMQLPLETIAYQCFLAQLSNPVKNEYRTEFAVLAKRSFDAAEAFCQEAWNQKKGKKV